MNRADEKMLNIFQQVGDNYQQTFERISAELLLGVIIPENPMLNDYLTMVKPLIELVFECKKQEMKEWGNDLQPQPVKISRS